MRREEAIELRAAIGRLEQESKEPIAIIDTLKMLESLDAMMLAVGAMRLVGFLAQLEELKRIEGGKRSAARIARAIHFAERLLEIQPLAFELLRARLEAAAEGRQE